MAQALMDSFPMCFFGYGYVADFICRHMPVAPVQATTRNRNKAAVMQQNRINALVVDFHSVSENALKSIDSKNWLISIPPDDDGCSVYAAMQNTSPRPDWIGYLSSTSVYGNLNGKWAFENMTPAPASIRGKRRALAERQWLEMDAHIFRLPGIYGPGRSALDAVAKPTTVRTIKPEQVFSRTHVADIASAVIASLHRPNHKRIYNVADDLPAPSDAVLSYAAELLGLPEPPAVDWDDPAMPLARRRFYTENRRISNARLKAELGWKPQYPNYRCGLDAIYADMLTHAYKKNQ